MESSPLKCRLCNADAIYKIGKVPDCKEFAGQLLESPMIGGDLWACGKCHSMFKHPILPAETYISLYEKAAEEVWDPSKIQRLDMKIIYSYLSAYKIKNILDIGCFSGEFLTGMPAGIKRYGIEPSKSAARVAELRGVEVLAPALSSLNTNRKFDVVVSIDVIEHVEDVPRFLDQAFSLVNENGILIISTGNPNYLGWRKIFKSRFWYSTYPEHITFPSYNFFNLFAQKNKLETPIKMNFRYESIPFRQKIVRFTSQLIFSISPKIYEKFKYYLSILLKRNSKNHLLALGAAGVFKDHQIIVIRNGSQHRHDL